MHKKALFLLKNYKNRPTLVASSQNPNGLRRLCPQTPPNSLPSLRIPGYATDPVALLNETYCYKVYNVLAEIFMVQLNN